MASYDDSGVTGHKSCYVLEEGCYEVFVGSDVRSAVSVGCYEEEFRVRSLRRLMRRLRSFRG